jgi:hypothetical protein
MGPACRPPIPDGQTGTVTVIQRFGSALRLNVHFHTLVLDGVFSDTRPGPLTFHPAPSRAMTAFARIQSSSRRHSSASPTTRGSVSPVQSLR